MKTLPSRLKILLFIPILFVAVINSMHGQIHSKVIDAYSEEPIAYANIMIEGSETRISTEKNGNFELLLTGTHFLVISAIGYSTLRISTDSIYPHISLFPEVQKLTEIKAYPRYRNSTQRVGRLQKSSIKCYFSNSISPRMMARYFPFQEEYKKTRYLDKIGILTMSKVKNAKFQIRLYRVDENGNPGDYLYNQSILGIAKKGKKITEIEVSDLNLLFPEEGFFVAIEPLFILENKTESIYKTVHSKTEKKAICYEPSFGAMKAPTNAQLRFHTKKDWITPIPYNNTTYPIKDCFNNIAIELTLSN